MNLLISITREIYAIYYRFMLRSYFFRKLLRIPPYNAQEEWKNNIKILNQISKVELKAASDLSKREMKLSDIPRDSNEKSFVGNVLNKRSSGDKCEKDFDHRFYNEIPNNETNLVHIKDNINYKNLSFDNNNKKEKVYDSFQKEKETNTFSFWDILKINLFKKNVKNNKYTI